MAFKLLQAAQDRWRAVNGPHLVALVRAGATFHKGQLVERPTDLAKKIRKTAPKKAPSTVHEKVAA
jgi:putative transposase